MKLAIWTLCIIIPLGLTAQRGGDGGLVIGNLIHARDCQPLSKTDTSLQLRQYTIPTNPKHSPQAIPDETRTKFWDVGVNFNTIFHYIQPALHTTLHPQFYGKKHRTAVEYLPAQRLVLIYKGDTMRIDFFGIERPNPSGTFGKIDTLWFRKGHFQYNGDTPARANVVLDTASPCRQPTHTQPPPVPSYFMRKDTKVHFEKRYEWLGVLIEPSRKDSILRQLEALAIRVEQIYPSEEFYLLAMANPLSTTAQPARVEQHLNKMAALRQRVATLEGIVYAGDVLIREDKHIILSNNELFIKWKPSTDAATQQRLLQQYQMIPIREMLDGWHVRTSTPTAYAVIDIAIALQPYVVYAEPVTRSNSVVDR